LFVSGGKGNALEKNLFIDGSHLVGGGKGIIVSHHRLKKRTKELGKSHLCERRHPHAPTTLRKPKICHHTVKIRGESESRGKGRGGHRAKCW